MDSFCNYIYVFWSPCQFKAVEQGYRAFGGNYLSRFREIFIEVPVSRPYHTAKQGPIFDTV